MSVWTACCKKHYENHTNNIINHIGYFYTHAQTMKKLIHTGDFENRLAKEAQTMQSIESDFTQVKYTDILDEKVTSKGKFYYQKERQNTYGIRPTRQLPNSDKRLPSLKSYRTVKKHYEPNCQ